MPTLHDVAERAGVSLSTVARFFRGESVGEETKKAIVKAKNDLKYRMDFQLDNFIQYKAVVYIGQFFSKSSFVLSVLESLKEEARVKNIDILIDIIDNPDFLKKEDVDGVFAMATDIEDEMQLKKIYVDINIPVLLINRKSSCRGISYITIDNFEAAYEAVNKLLSLGHRRIAIIKGVERFEPNIDRHKGYIKALEEKKIPICDNMILTGNNSEEDAYRAVKEMLKDKNTPVPTAIFSCSDIMAIGAIKAIQDSGLKVPDDISIIGFDDINLSSYIMPALTTVRTPEKKMGKLSADTMLRLIEDKDILRESVYLNHEFIIRDSAAKLKD